MFDLFFIADDDKSWALAKLRWPHSRRAVSSSDVIVKCARDSFTKMFYLVDPGYLLPNGFTIDNSWDFSYKPAIYDQDYIHTWQASFQGNTRLLDFYPIKLFPTRTILNHSDNVEDLFETVGHVKPMPNLIVHCKMHDLFFIWDNVDIEKDNNVWSNIISRFPNAKRIAGSPSLFLDVARISSTDMFYVVDTGFDFSQDWDFSYISPIWDRQYIHTWQAFDSLTSEPLGVYPIKLVPKQLILDNVDNIDQLFESVGHIKPMTDQIVVNELHDLFFIWDDVELSNNDAIWADIISRFPHAQRIRGTETVYSDLAKISSTNMFYVVEPGVVIDTAWDFKFTAPIWDRQYIHTWQAFDSLTSEPLGVYPIKLVPKQLILDHADNIDQLFESVGHIKPMTNQVVVSELFDLFFVSYNEPNADQNWENLKSQFPYAKRVHGIKGIDNAHRECAKQSATSMFWTVDGDTVVDDSFKFDYIAPRYDRLYTHIWYSRNPINGLEYGYGAVKLWPRDKVAAHNGSWLDYTVSVGQVKIIEDVIATTYFDSTPYETWKSAFRECVKLVRNIDKDAKDLESSERLTIWLTKSNDRPNSTWSLTGAKDAVEWYHSHPTHSMLINDFSWLSTFFNIKYI